MRFYFLSSCCSGCLARLLPALLLMGLAGMASVVRADHSVMHWRTELARIRALAENDAPRAMRELGLLQAVPHTDLSVPDRIGLLNLSARIETYLAQTGLAEQHALEALSLARQDQNKVGQIEANLVIMLNSINQARIDRMREATEQTLPLLDGVGRQDLFAETMLRAAMLYFRHGQLAAGMTMAWQNLEIAQRSQHSLALTYAHQGLAIAYEQSGMRDKAHAHYQRMRGYAHAAQSRQLEALAMSGAAGVLASQRKMAEAENLQKQALALIELTGMPFNISHVRFNLSHLLRLQGRQQESIALMDKVVATYRRYPNQIGLWWALNTRAGDLLAMGNIIGAEQDAEAASRLARLIGFPLYLAESGKRMAEIAAARGDYSHAYQFRAEADHMASQAEQDKLSELILSLTERYRLETKQRQIDALTHREAEKIREVRQLWMVFATSLTMFMVTAFLLLRLRRSHRRLQQLSTELRRSRNRMQATLDTIPDLLFELDLAGRCYHIHAPRQALLGRPPAELINKTVSDVLPAAAAETCLQALREANTVGASSGHQFMLDLPQGQCWFELSVARKTMVGMHGIPHFIVLSRDITERKLKEREIAESRDLLRQLSARRDAVREEERKRIAREIHDELGQMLTAQRLEIATLKFQFGEQNHVLAERCQHLMQLTDQTIQVVRNIAATLRPASLDMGIVPALEWLVAEFHARTGVACQFDVGTADMTLDEEQSIAVFRIVQESLTNIARHANAHQVRIALDARHGEYCLSIQDDGNGFDADQRNNLSFGLVGIRERVLILGGKAEIVSAPGQGCTVDIHLPHLCTGTPHHDSAPAGR